MNAAPLFAPVLPPGTSPARPAQGEGASDGAGQFAVLLAGMQPLPTSVAPGTDPPAPPAAAFALPLAGGSAPPAAAPTPAAHPQRPPPSASVGAEAPTTGPAAQDLPPALPGPARADSGQGGPPPQLAPASPEPGSPVPASAQSADRTRPAPQSSLADPISGRTQAPGHAVAALPPTPALGAGAPVTPSVSLQTTIAPPARPEAVSMPLAGDAQVPVPTRAWSLQASAPRAATDTTIGQSRGLPSAATGERSIGPAGPEVARPHAALIAPTSGTPGSAADKPVADEHVWLEPHMEASEGAVSRSEQAASEPVRVSAMSRAAPPAPMFQLGVQIARAVPARIDRLLVQLEPASLGRVEVRLEFHRDNQVSAVIAAERPDTLDALQRDARVLERSLHQAGLRLDSDGLTFSLKREQAHDQGREERRLAPPAGDFGDRPLLAAHGHEASPVQWLRGLRALDIRV